MASDLSDNEGDEKDGVFAKIPLRCGEDSEELNYLLRRQQVEVNETNYDVSHLRLLESIKHKKKSLYVEILSLRKDLCIGKKTACVEDVEGFLVNSLPPSLFSNSTTIRKWIEVMNRFNDISKTYLKVVDRVEELRFIIENPPTDDKAFKTWKKSIKKYQDSLSLKEQERTVYESTIPIVSYLGKRMSTNRVVAKEGSGEDELEDSGEQVKKRKIEFEEVEMEMDNDKIVGSPTANPSITTQKPSNELITTKKGSVYNKKKKIIVEFNHQKLKDTTVYDEEVGRILFILWNLKSSCLAVAKTKPEGIIKAMDSLVMRRVDDAKQTIENAPNGRISWNEPDSILFVNSPSRYLGFSHLGELPPTIPPLEVFWNNEEGLIQAIQNDIQDIEFFGKENLNEELNKSIKKVKETGNSQQSINSSSA